MTIQHAFLIGVDGGGSSTRVRVERPDGSHVCQANGGPSGLAHGVERAWSTILATIEEAFASVMLTAPAHAGMAIGLGLAGVHNRRWADAFAAQNPGFGAFALASDGYTTLYGAHRGQPGAIIAIGTGSIGEVLTAAGEHREVGGWGFPAGDEGSGAWMGLQAVNHAQRMQDGRALHDAFGQAVVDFCGASRAALFDWLAQANQTAYAGLAPLVVEYAPREPAAAAIMQAAGREIEQLAHALDPAGTLPLALCGGLGDAVRSFLPAPLQARISAARQDAVGGALLLIRRHIAAGAGNPLP